MTHLFRTGRHRRHADAPTSPLPQPGVLTGADASEVRAMASKFPRRLRALGRDRSGAATVMLALSFTTLMGAAAVGVDVGNLFLAKRQLQGIADAAALAAAAGDIAGAGTTAAQSIIDESGQSGVTISQLTPGTYSRDASIAPAARFTAGASQPSAAQLVLERPVPVFFGRFLTGNPAMTVRAQATAARMDMAAFSIGTRLAALSGGLPNQLLSALAGTQLNLSVLDGQALASAQIDLLGFADALGAQLGREETSYATLFNSDIPLQTLVRALAQAAPDLASRNVLDGIAPRLGTQAVRLADLIDLGPLGQTTSHDGSSPLRVDAFSFLRALLESAQGESYQATLDVSVPGLAATRLTLTGGGGTAHSPWMTVTQARDVVIRTSQARIYLETTLLSAISGIATLRLPVYVDLAEAQARLANISCGGNGANDGVTLAVTPAIGTVAIADITPAQLGNFSTPMPTHPAVLANVLGTRINAAAELHLGGVTAQNVRFTRDDIANHTPRTVSTNDLTTGLAQSLARSVQISVTVLGITVNTGPLVGAVGSQLGVVAPLIDGLLNQVTGLLGVQLGSATTWVDRMRCGVPMLVA